jgi:hypothetical protein
MAEQYDAILIWGLPGAETADLLAFGHAAGIPTLYQTGDADELHENIKKFSAKTGPRMLVLEIAREEPSAQWPKISMRQQIQDARAHFLRRAR